LEELYGILISYFEGI